MKKIEAILRPVLLEAVKAALAEAGITGMTVGDMGGTVCANSLRLRPKVKLELTVRDEGVDAIIAPILAPARTGEAGDGKIFVLPALEARRIRTGEVGRASCRRNPALPRQLRYG